MAVLSELEPNKVFKYFEEICSIPHGSNNVKQISDYLVDFAKAHNLKYRQDDDLNVIIWKDGSKGYEDSEPVILQGHMDMVAVQEADCKKDMEKEGLDLEINGDFISAKGTSLGGDDGIAVAYTLAVLDDEEMAHPPIEAIFTVNEEIGMLGAASIDVSDLKGRLFMNTAASPSGSEPASRARQPGSAGRPPHTKRPRGTARQRSAALRACARCPSPCAYRGSPVRATSARSDSRGCPNERSCPQRPALRRGAGRGSHPPWIPCRWSAARAGGSARCAGAGTRTPRPPPAAPERRCGRTRPSCRAGRAD